MTTLSSKASILLSAASVVQAFVATPPQALNSHKNPFSTLIGTPTSQRHIHGGATQNVGISALNMAVDPSILQTTVETSSSILHESSNMLLSFTDQGKNLAGIFFQASLLPYLLFLYFLSFRANQIPALGNFGFQFVLLFVISTIPSGIISKSVYGYSLADTDYLHGGAELLLTVANVLIVLGFKEAMTKPEQAPIDKPRNIALALAASFAALCALGPMLLQGHTPFLFGLGNIPADQVALFPWVVQTEPTNALSIPTWAIHFSSVFEYVFAMGLVWQFAETTGNERWKGLTWGMLPLHASGICACTYHFFYNPPSLQFLVTSQAGLTLVGNITLMIAAFRIAQSNGWTVQELIPAPSSSTSPKGLVADGLAMKPLILQEGPAQSNTDLALSLVAATLSTSYLVKYGELGLDLPFSANPYAALAIIIGIPGATAYYFYKKSTSQGEEFDPLSFLPKISLPGQEGKEGPSLSMEDVKKYGVAGTVAYVITELAFWLVAFPVAAIALNKSTGHWPDVINDTNDRAAVLAFIFAGANIARAFVPLRLGAALALAPWVDENILSRMQSAEEPSSTSSAEEMVAANIKEAIVQEETVMKKPSAPPKETVVTTGSPQAEAAASPFSNMFSSVSSAFSNMAPPQAVSSPANPAKEPSVTIDVAKEAAPTAAVSETQPKVEAPKAKPSVEIVNSRDPEVAATSDEDPIPFFMQQTVSGTSKQ